MRKLSDRDRGSLLWIVRKDPNTAPKNIAELKDHLEKPVSSKTVRRELYKARFDGRSAIRKLYENKFVWNSKSYHYFVQLLYPYI